MIWHLCQPAWGRNAGLLLDCAQERWQALEEIANGPGTASGTISPRRSCVPHRNLRLETIDCFRVRLSEFLVGVVLQHHVLEKTLRATQDFSHVPIGFGHLGDTFRFLLLCIESRFRFFGGTVILLC